MIDINSKAVWRSFAVDNEVWTTFTSNEETVWFHNSMPCIHIPSRPDMKMVLVQGWVAI